MKKFFYWLFALFFNMSRIFPVKKNRVALLAPHRGGSHDSLGEIRAYLENAGGYEIKEISTSQLNTVGGALDFFLNKSRLLATSAFVFMNDNFMPMAYLRFSDKTKVVQLWHAEGAFKKFGLMTDLAPAVRNREIKGAGKLSYVVCSSKKVAPVYAAAFGVDLNKVVPLGSPRTDYLFRAADTEKLRREFDEKFPACKGKKLVLYAPTFRDNPQRDREIISHIDMAAFEKHLGKEYAFITKLHPQVHTSDIPGDIINVTAEDIGNLTLICDLVVTDYSSVCMDFALLGKPCIFFAYDLDEYENERNFCFGYENYVPGPVVKTFDGVIYAVENQAGTSKLLPFRDFNFDYTDGKSTERVVNFIMKA